jgi:hypothetical protein
LLTDWKFWTCCAVALVAGIAGGYWLSPTKVETRTEVKTEWKIKEVEKRVEVAGKEVERVKIVYRTIERKPDGSEHVTELEDSSSHTLSVSALHLDRTTDATGKQASVTLTRPVGPDWRVAVLAGASLKEPLLPIAGPLVLGLEVDRRIIGPFWLGAWVSTSGAAGLAVSGVF